MDYPIDCHIDRKSAWGGVLALLSDGGPGSGSGMPTPMINSTPRRATIGPCVYSYFRVLGGLGFL